jgi:hypothetical protein
MIGPGTALMRRGFLLGGRAGPALQKDRIGETRASHI